MKRINVFTTRFYGSLMWDIMSKDCDRILRSWNVTVRHTLDLERQTHRNLIEPLSGCLHPKAMLASRLVSIYKAFDKESEVQCEVPGKVSWKGPEDSTYSSSATSTAASLTSLALLLWRRRWYMPDRKLKMNGRAILLQNWWMSGRKILKSEASTKKNLKKCFPLLFISGLNPVFLPHSHHHQFYIDCVREKNKQ